MKTENHLPAGKIIQRLCDQLGYSRPHVASLLRDHAREIGAVRRGGRWTLPRGGEFILRRLIKSKSGPRYKLGETGANRKSGS